MQADQLQKYVMTLITKVKGVKSKERKENAVYHEAMNEVIALLQDERDVIIKSYNELKERGAV